MTTNWFLLEILFLLAFLTPPCLGFFLHLFFSCFCIALFFLLPHKMYLFLGNLFRPLLILHTLLGWSVLLPCLIILFQICHFIRYIEFKAHMFVYLENSPWKSKRHPTQHVQNWMHHPTLLLSSKLLLCSHLTTPGTLGEIWLLPFPYPINLFNRSWHFYLKRQENMMVKNRGLLLVEGSWVKYLISLASVSSAVTTS